MEAHFQMRKTALEFQVTANTPVSMAVACKLTSCSSSVMWVKYLVGRCLPGAGLLGDGLAALRNSGLGLPGGDGGPLVNLSPAMGLKMLLAKGFMILMALEVLPVAGWTCFCNSYTQMPQFQFPVFLPLFLEAFLGADLDGSGLLLPLSSAADNEE